jgi:hypothetical protein
MCSSLAPERINGFYSDSVFNNLFTIGRCLINMNILAIKIGALEWGPEHKIAIFFKMALTISTKFQ